MTVTYFKRYRMQIDLREGIPEHEPLAAGYEFVPWSFEALAAHSEAKYRSFRSELDSNVFPCLGEAEGCLRLMKEISSRQGFVKSATWLIRFLHADTGRIENCGTVQGIKEQSDVGSIQNVGIVPGHRGKGLGVALVCKSLSGFHEAGVNFVTLEVTAHNAGALKLYRRLRFQTMRTVLKSVDVDYPE